MPIILSRSSLCGYSVCFFWSGLLGLISVGLSLVSVVSQWTAWWLEGLGMPHTHAGGCKLSAQVRGWLGCVNLILQQTSLGLLTWWLQGSKHRKRRQVPMCKCFTGLCLGHIYYCPMGQRSHMTDPIYTPLLNAKSHSKRTHIQRWKDSADIFPIYHTLFPLH